MKDKKEELNENREEAEKLQVQKDPEMVEKSVPAQPSSTQLQDLPISHFLETIIDRDKKLDRLIQLFEDKIKNDETKGMVFERLHKELTQYRDDFFFDKILRRLFDDMIRLFDRINKVNEDYSSSEFELKDVIKAIDSFSKEIIQILKRQEVTMMETNKDKFDETFQEATEVEYTDDPGEDLDIAEVIRNGFIYRERIVLRPEIVKVKKYKGE